MRLDKYLSDAGIGTRSEVKTIIRQGRIKINGNVAFEGKQQVDPQKDAILFDEYKLGFKGGFKYFILNKPAGVITATEDSKQETVLDLLPKELRKNMSPVGRLDKDTEGLLLITDDGKLAHRLLSPKHHIEKKYYAEIKGEVTEKEIEIFKSGMSIGDEKPLLPAGLKLLSNTIKDGEMVSQVIVTISEGRYHQIKRMFQACGMEVAYLKRISMGNITLPDDLNLGEFREISIEEIEK